MSESELRQAWGREVLRERGYTVDDDAHVSFELDYGMEGCCDYCESTYAHLLVSSSGNTVTLRSGDFY